MNNATNTALKSYTHSIITVDGRTTTTIGAYSSGPGCAPHSFDVGDGAYVYQVGKEWTLQQPGQFPRKVTVEVVRPGGWL